MRPVVGFILLQILLVAAGLGLLRSLGLVGSGAGEQAAALGAALLTGTAAIGIALIGLDAVLLLIVPSFLIIAILSPQFRGKTWLLFVVLLAAFSWMITARIVRGLTLSLKEREFIDAARASGGPR